jgi:hypothetical protein
MRSSISPTHVQLIIDSMREMEELTKVNDVPCIQFRPRNDADDIYISIQNGSGCSSHVGYLQPYTLNRTVTLMHAPPRTCMIKGIVQHELLHAIGFWHEQSRTDRDDNVAVQWGNIQPGLENNFNKYSAVDADDLGVQYDYGSVMHYGRNDFSKNGLPTLIPTKDPNAVIGQRVGMSPSDILEVQRYYGCVETPRKNI